MRYRLQILFIVTSLMFLLTSCTRENVSGGIEKPSVDERVISFKADVDNLNSNEKESDSEKATQAERKIMNDFGPSGGKAFKDYAIDEINDIVDKYGGKAGLFAVYTGIDSYKQGTEYSFDKFVYFNNCLTLDSKGNCTIDPERYWPSYDKDATEKEKLSFFAMVPYDAGADIKKIDPYHMDMHGVIHKNNPFIHIDPLYSNSVDLDSESNGGKVKLNFKHAMSRFTFRVKADFSKEEKEKFMKELTNGQYSQDKNYYYHDCNPEQVIVWYKTRWKIMDVDLLFLVDNVKIENVRAEACVNLMATDDDKLWHIHENSDRYAIEVLQDDLDKEISYSNKKFPRPQEMGVNSERVWENDTYEVKGNDANWRTSDGRKDAPWHNKKSIDAKYEEKAHPLFKDDIYIIPGNYSKEGDKIKITLSYHAVLVGVFQKEFTPGSSYTDRYDPDATEWYWYDNPNRLGIYPHYRRFYAKINEDERTIGPVELNVDKIEPNKHYNATLGVGVTSSKIDITVKDWDEVPKEEIIEDEQVSVPEFTDVPIKWTKNSDVEVKDFIEDGKGSNSQLTYINLNKNDVATGTFIVPNEKGARLMVNVIPIKGDPDSFTFEDIKGIPKIPLDGKKQTIKIKCNGGRRDESQFILRFYLEFSDGTHKTIFGMNGKDNGEYILRYKKTK